MKTDKKNAPYAKMMHKFLSLILLVFLSGHLYSQVNESVFQGSYHETPFPEFVTSVENSIPVRFFYDSVQVKDIRITASGDALKLPEVLQSAFASSGLMFYMDQYQNVIIYQGPVSIIEELPGFSPKENTPVVPEQPERTYMTETERKYLNGKATSEIETIVVGNRQQMVQSMNCIVRGRMVVRETGEPLVGATIYLTETGAGAATDADGYFRLIVKPGKYSAKAACVSMKEKPFFLEVYSDGFIPVRMEKATINLSEVTVSAERHDNVAGLQMGYEHVLTKNMKEIPVALGERDLLKVATLLPGVQTAGEGSSGLIVRGGTADQNLFYLNRIPVYNTSHLFGFFTSFSPDVVSDFTLYKSNIPASYGGRVSSVFDITTRKGNKKKFFGQGGISPVTGHFELEGPVWKDNSSFVVSGRSSYSDWILSRMNDINLKNSNANFYDVTAGLNTELNNENLVKIFGYSSFDQFTLSSSDEYTYANNGASASWKHLFSSALTIDLSAVYSQYWFNHNEKKNPSEAYAHKYILLHREVKADFTILTSKNHDIRFGASGILYQLDRGSILPFGEESTRLPVELGKEKGMESALFFSDDFPVTRKLSVSAGLRYSFYGQLGPGEINEYDPAKQKNVKSITGTKSFGSNAFIKTYSGPEIRMALNQRLGAENSIKASYNRLRQYLFMLTNTMAVSPDDQWKLADYYMKPPVCDQVSFGYYQDYARKGFSSSLEIYRKWTRNVVEYRDGISFISGDKAEMQLLQGLQDSYGLELMLKKSTGKTTGWLSYTYSNATVVVKGEQPFDVINNGMRFPSNYDRPHSLNLVTNMRYSRRFSFSYNVVYSTGRPVSYPVAVYKYENKYLLHYSARNEYRLPDYFRVDCSFNMEGNLLSKKRIHSSWMLNVYNVTGRKNAYSVYFESDEGKVQGYKLSVFAQPVFTLSWNFKFGNYANE